MTEQELQTVVAAVIQALKTNGKTIDQLTSVQTLQNSDCFEVSGGRKVSYEVLLDLLSDAIVIDTDGITADIANVVIQSVSFSVTGSTATLSIKQQGYDAKTVSVPVATDSQSGIITAADKVKLDSAYTTANSAAAAASGAQSTANQALTAAGAAQTAASNASTAASNAQTAADVAQDAADAAQAAAEAAQKSSDGLSEAVGAMKKYGYKFIGVATPTTEPGTPSENVFYLATTEGDYTHFPTNVATDEGPIHFHIGADEVAILRYTKPTDDTPIITNWSKVTLNLAKGTAITEIRTEIDEVVNGKQKTTITTEFTANYQYIALETPIPSGTTIANISGKVLAMYDKVNGTQIGINFLVGTTQTIDAEVGCLRTLSGAGISVIEYGEEVAGLSEKVNDAISSAENASGSVQTLNTKLYGKEETIVSVTFSDTITQVKLDTPIPAGTKIYSDGKTIYYRDIDKNELAAAVEDTIVSTNKDIHYVSIYPTPTATKVVNIHYCDAVKGEVEDIAFAQDKDYVIVDKSDEFIRVGSVNHNDGTFVSSGSNFRTPYLYVGDVESVLAILPNIDSTAGMAFYDNEHTFINANIQNTQSNRWIMIPEGAVYMMTTCPDGVQPLLLLKKRAKKESKSIVENLAMRSNAELPSRSHLIYDYKDFVLDDGSPATPRVSLTGSSRVMLNTNDRLQDKKFVAHIRIADATTHVFFGNEDSSLSNADDYINTIEVRINGGKFQVWKITGTPTMLTEDTLSFSLNAGDVISVGYERFDKVEGSDYSKATYFIKSGENSFEKEFEYRNDITAGGVMYSSIAGLMGKAYIGISSGSSELLNYYIVSSNNPKAKVLIFGDSFTGGNTLSSAGTIHKRFCSLIKARIGDKDCVIAGKGGEEINAYSIEPMKRLASKYLPKYMIIELGENNANLLGYTTAMDNMLSYLKQIGVEPILMTVNAFGNKATGATDTRRSLRLSMEEYIKSKGCLYVDMFNACCIDENGVARYKDGYGLPDLIHPSVLGHQAIYEAFCNEVPEIFE